MNDTVYLVLTRRGVDRLVKTRLPKLSGGQVAVKLSIHVDDDNFRTPLAEANLELGANHLILNPEVEVTVEDGDE